MEVTIDRVRVGIVTMRDWPPCEADEVRFYWLGGWARGSIEATGPYPHPKTRAKKAKRR